MPTIIVLDLSLSMLRPSSQSSTEVIDIDKDPDDKSGGTTLLDLAKLGIESFLTYLEKNSKLEFVSLIGYILDQFVSINIIKIKHNKIKYINENIAAK